MCGYLFTLNFLAIHDHCSKQEDRASRRLPVDWNVNNLDSKLKLVQMKLKRERACAVTHSPLISWLFMTNDETIVWNKKTAQVEDSLYIVWNVNELESEIEIKKMKPSIMEVSQLKRESVCGYAFALNFLAIHDQWWGHCSKQDSWLSHLGSSTLLLSE